MTDPSEQLQDSQADFDPLEESSETATETAPAASGESTSAEPEAPTPSAAPAESTTNDPAGGTNHLLKMKVPVIAKVAQKRAMLEDILKLNIGSLLQFDRDAYQPADLMANNQTIGLGQPVKIGEAFGLKITQIGTPEETLKKLGPG